MKFLAKQSVAIALILLSLSSWASSFEVERESRQVRSDIQVYIDESFTVKRERDAVYQAAEAAQLVLSEDLSTDEAVVKVNAQITRSVTCLYHTFEGTTLKRSPGRISAIISIRTYDTTARQKVRRSFNAALSGKAWSLPEGDGCKQGRKHLG